MNFDDLKNPELQERLKACNSPEELLAHARELGFELSDEALDGIAGGRECLPRAQDPPGRPARRPARFDRLHQLLIAKQVVRFKPSHRHRARVAR